MRRSVLFWNWLISWKVTVPGQYLWLFFTFLALRNSFWGALPPTVGWSFLLASSSLPNVDGPASAASWANCQVGNDSSNLPTYSNISASTLLLSISPGVGGASTSGTGGSASVWGSTGGACTSTHVFYICRAFLPSPSCISENFDMISAVHFAMLLFPTMPEEWSKYAKILEREDREFKRGMW